MRLRIAYLIGALGAVAALFLGTIGLLIGLLVGGVVFLTRSREGLIGRQAQLLGRVLNGGFFGFFLVYTAAALIFLLAGLGAALSAASPSLHRTLHAWGGTVPATHVQGEIVARDIEFTSSLLRFEGAGETKLKFTNLDGDGHNVAIYTDASREELIFRGALITGPRTVEYEFQLPPPGKYFFVCDPHLDMKGTVVVEGGGTGAAEIETSLPEPLAALSLRTAEASHAGQPGSRAVLQYLFSVLNVAMGILLLRLRPRDATARLLAVGMIGTGAVFNLQAHTALTAIPALAGRAHDTFHLVAGLAYLLALLLFPDGRLPHWAMPPALRWPLRAVFLFAFVVAGLTLSGEIHGDPGDYVTFFGVMVPIAGVVSQASRYRHAASAEQRQQSKILLWTLGLAFGAALLFIAFIVVLGGTSEAKARDIRELAFSVFPALFAVIPVVLVAVLVRYRLWDIERVINKTLVYGTLAAFITTVYVAAVVGISRAVGAGENANVAWYILATAVIAVAFEPLRERLQRVANRLVYGKRSTPYEVMANFSERMAGVLSIEEVLPRMAEAAARCVDAVRSQARVLLTNGQARTVSWPADTEGDGFDRTIAVSHKGEPVGEISVAKAPGDRLTPAEGKLLDDLAAQAGLVLRNVGLTVELQDRLEEISRQAGELRASRQRIVAVQDAERRRLERDIHDGAQQQLVGMSVKLRLAAGVIDRDPARAGALLDELGRDANATLENLRDLARGIFPPLLADQGLAAALQAQVRKSGLPIRVDVDLGHAPARFDPQAEAAAYFCCLEALTNAAKHAPGAPITLSLEIRGGLVEFRVIDAGPGFDPDVRSRGTGIQNMSDRLEAVRGTLEIRSVPGQGTTVVGRVPANVMEPVG